VKIRRPRLLKTDAPPEGGLLPSDITCLTL
jgi:hypothetical protein